MGKKRRSAGAVGDAPFLRLGLFYVCVFAVLGVAMPFWPLFLAGRGFAPVEVSLILSVAIWTRTVAGPAWCAFADHGDRHRRTMQGLALGTVLVMCLFLFEVNLVGAVMAMALSAVTWPAILSLLDGTTIGWCSARGVDYGRIRLWGSLAFLGTNAAVGWFLVGRSHEWVLVLLLLLDALVFGASFLLPPQRRRAPGPHLSFASLLRVRSFALLLLATLLIQGSHGAYYALSSIHWEHHGISSATIGLLWGEGVMAEVVLFALAGRYLRWRPSSLMALGAIAATLRWTVFAGTTAVGALAFVQVLHAFTYGATHLAGVRWIAKHVPAGRVASAQAVLAAVSVGLGLGLATPLAGLAYERSPGLAFLAMAGLAGLGFGAALVLRNRGQETG